MGLEQTIASECLTKIRELPRQNDVTNTEIVYQYDNKSKQHKWRVYIYGVFEDIRYVDASYDAWTFYQSGSDRDIVTKLIEEGLKEIYNVSN